MEWASEAELITYRLRSGQKYDIMKIIGWNHSQAGSSRSRVWLEDRAREDRAAGKWGLAEVTLAQLRNANPRSIPRKDIKSKWRVCVIYRLTEEGLVNPPWGPSEGVGLLCFLISTIAKHGLVQHCATHLIVPRKSLIIHHFPLQQILQGH